MLSLTFSLFLLFLSLFLLSHLFHSLCLKFKLPLFSLFLYRPATHRSRLPLSIPFRLSLSSLSLFHFHLSLFLPPLSVALCLSLTRSLPVCFSFFSFSPFLFSPSISLFFLPLLSLALYIIQRLLFLLNTAGVLEFCQREQRGALLVLTYCKATLKGSPD